MQKELRCSTVLYVENDPLFIMKPDWSVPTDAFGIDLAATIYIFEISVF